MNKIKNCPKLNFPPRTFRVNEREGKLKIWDDIRGCWLVLTPEEWVRRHLIGFLTAELAILPQLITQECPVLVQGMPQRSDVVVYDRRGAPLLLAECKAPDVKVDAAVYAQAIRYNAVLGARFVVITNGLAHYLFERCGEEYVKLDSFPPLSEYI